MSDSRNVLDGYTVHGEIGRNGPGVVYDAADEDLGRPVALKTLHGASEDARRVFRREARITARLDHPNIPAVHAFNELSDGTVYFTMKRVEGRSLETVLSDVEREHRREATLLESLAIVDRVCDALAFAHDRGVIHCAVKPANVMVGNFRQVYLMDWGAARLIGDVEDGTADTILAGLGGTDTRAMLGSLRYMSPEQASGNAESLDARTDVFAVGAMLYRILTGRAPYEGDDLKSLLDAARNGRFEPIRPGNDALAPASLRRIIHRAMAPEPAQRFPSVSDMQRAVTRFIRGGSNFPRERHAAGAHIIRQGRRAEAAYVLVEGECSVHRHERKQEVPMGVLKPGAVFGETALLTSGDYAISVVTKTDVAVLRIEAPTFAAEVDGMRPWMSACMRGLARRFRQNHAMLAEIVEPARLRALSAGVLRLRGRAIEPDVYEMELETLEGSLGVHRGLADALSGDDSFSVDGSTVRLRHSADLEDRLWSAVLEDPEASNDWHFFPR